MLVFLVSIAAGIAGYFLGLGTCFATLRLGAGDDPSPPQVKPPLVLDPWVQGIDALAFFAVVLLGGIELRSFAACLLILPLVQVAVTDVRTQYVYTPIPAAGIAAGIILSGVIQPTVWAGLVGAIGAGLVFWVIYLVGILVGRRRYSGAKALAFGDVWIAGMVGAVAGSQTPAALFGGVLLGGLFGVAILVVRRDSRIFVPYGPGLCIGGAVGLFLTLTAR